MIGTNIFQPEPLPSMWKVILFRIWQAEQRDRILSDWEDNVFGSLEQRREAAAALSPGGGGLGFEPDDPAWFYLIDNCVTARRPLQVLGKHHCSVMTGKFPDLLSACRIHDNPTSIYHSPPPYS
jgi:hypothetical protein